MKKKLVIINNEKCIKINNQVYCQNVEIKSLSEALNLNFNTKSKIRPVHKIKTANISLSSNIIGFIFHILKEFKDKDSRYLIISITPYTFMAYLFLILKRKNIFLYLRSDGLEEYKIILGKKLAWIYRFMLFLMSKKSTIFCVNEKIISNYNYKLLLPSQLDLKWFEDTQEANLKDVKLLYVGRIKIEKGVFSLLNLYKKINLNIPHSLTLIGHGEKIENISENVTLMDPLSNVEDLIKMYDCHNITILPSFTEGHPQILIESLARMRPIIIFDDINFVKKNYYGVFVSRRDSESLVKTIKQIMENYKIISEQMKKNILPTKEIFIKNLTKELTSNI